MKQEKKQDLYLMLLWPLLATFISFQLSANFLASFLLFLGAPSVYLAYKNPKYIKKVSIFAAIIGMPFLIATDYIMKITGGWDTVIQSIFSIKLFGSVPFEMTLWMFLYYFYVAIFYESFLDSHKKVKLIYPRFKYIAILWWSLFVIFTIIYFSNTSFLSINLYYFKIGIFVAIIPLALILYKHPKLLPKLFKTSSYFLYVTALYEITALKLGQWSFPATLQSIFYINLNIFGQGIPIEEIVIWIILGGAITIAYYEFFDDDRK